MTIRKDKGLRAVIESRFGGTNVLNEEGLVTGPASAVVRPEKSVVGPQQFIDGECAWWLIGVFRRDV